MFDMKLLNLLKLNGLSECESKVYLVLLNNPNSTPTQVHDLVEITRTKIYEVLSSLLSKGLIAEELVGRKKAYIVLNPETSFETIIQKKENEFRAFTDSNEKLVQLASEIYKNSDSDRSPFYQLEHLSDPVNIRERMFYYIGNAKKELLIFLKPPYVSYSGEFDSLMSTDLKVRTLWEYPPDQMSKDLLKKIELEPNDEVRFIEELPLKLFIIDSKITILALGTNDSRIGSINTIFLNEPIVAQFMIEIFESRWKKAISLEEYLNSVS